MTSYTVESILDERLDYSSYSAEESFTLSDILAEKDVFEEDLLIEKEVIEDGMFDDYFQDEQQPQETQKEKEVSETPAKAEQKQDFNQPSGEKLQVEFSSPNIDQVKRREGSVIKRSSSRGSGGERSPLKTIAIDRCKRIESLPVPPLSNIKNISFIVLGNVTAAFDENSKGVGIPTVITSNSIKYLAIGTSFGNVVLFEVGNKSKKVLGSAQNRKYGSITSMAISRQGSYLVSGQQNGMVTIWDLTTMAQVKKEMATTSKIIKILFCSENQFLLADLQGNVLLFTIQNYFWVKIKKDRLFEKTQSIFYDVKIHTLQSGAEVIVLCSLQQILVATYTPKVEAIDRLTPPDEFLSEKVPNIEIGKTAIMSIQNPHNKLFYFNDVLCVSWSNIILVYKFNECIRLERLQLVYRFAQQTPIYNMEFISEGVLVTLDSKDTFRSFRIWINDNGGHQMLNEKFIPEEVIYQRYVRDNSSRFIKVFNNTMICCNFNPKQKELFFIAKNSIYRCRVYKWNEYISDLLVNENKWEESLKICIQIYYNRMNIFLDPVVNNDKTMKIFCQVGKIFLKKKFEFIEALQIDRAINFQNKDQIKNVKEEIEQTFDCIIEYMLEIKSSEELFNSIYTDIIKTKFKDQEDVHHKFLDCLEPFIMTGRLTALPSRTTFEELIDYYLPQNKRQLIDNLIMFLNVETVSMFYEEAISICSINKLYKSLAYVCSTHGDYISPLTGLLNEIKMAQNNHMSSAQESYYTMFKDYTIKLLASCYINGISFQDESSTMKKSLSNWLMCRETFIFFAENEVESYHQDYFYLIEELVYLLSSEPQLGEYVHKELKNILAQKFRRQEVAELLIKISGCIQLDAQQIKLIVEYSNSQLIEKYLNKFLNFYKTYQAELNLLPDLQAFYTKNKQLHYFHFFLKANEVAEEERVLPKASLLDGANYELNGQLTKYILNKMNQDEVLWNLQDLLKIHSQNTMVFTLQRFPLQTVNDRLLSIKDPSYRYLVVRKILKLMRKENKKDKIKKYHVSKPENSSPNSSSLGNPTGSKISLGKSKLIVSRQTEIEGLMGLEELEKCNSDRKKLGKNIMQFYISCLCKYKNEKRVYYELVCNINDYYDTIEELIDIIQKYEFNSCLGLLEETRKNYEQAYDHYVKVYRHFFFEENYKKLISISHCHGRFMRRIFERMLTLTSVINKDDRWMEILKCIINPLEEKGKIRPYVCDDIQDVYTKVGKSHPFLRQLGEIIEQCLINVSTKVPIETISTYIGQHSYVFSRMFVLEAFRTTLLTYSNNSKLFSTTNEMIIHHQVAIFQEIYNNLIKGITPEMRCLKCNKEFDEEHPMKVYLCGHSYHKWCPGNERLFNRIDYRFSTACNKELSLIKDQEDLDQDDKCRHCEMQRNRGNIEMKELSLPDFHKEYEQNILVKGVVGIATIIPNMIIAIPGSLTAFSSFMSPEEKMMAPPVDEPDDHAALDDQVLSYLAFIENIEGITCDNQKFISECSRYFEESI